MKRTRTAATDARLAVAYLRVSTDDQHLGTDAQRAAITAWATREGVTIAAWHTDQGVSGGAAIADRPALLAALADLSTLRAGVFAVAKRDRLARDVMAAAMCERMVADEVAWLGAKAEELLAEYDRLRPAHAFTTFAAVEAAWKERVEPALPRFESMQRIWSWQAELPPDSPWNLNR